MRGPVVFRRTVAVAFLISCSAAAALAQSSGAFRPIVVDEGDVLTRGPVHEAFAEPVVFDPGPGVVVDRPPPELIDELPPVERPDGPYVTWIPGYWAWDDDYNEYIWVSGIWRDIPPGREWIAGYWARSVRGYQWISGYWDSVNSTETVYLPEPPEFVDAQSERLRSPAANQVWIPGCWVWHDSRYA